jgi:transcription elongation factor Elf1
MQLFWSTCPNCEREFVVSDELRNDEHQLWCPFCGNRYLASQSLKIGEGPAPRGGH